MRRLRRSERLSSSVVNFTFPVCTRVPALTMLPQFLDYKARSWSEPTDVHRLSPFLFFSVDISYPTLLSVFLRFLYSFFLTFIPLCVPSSLPQRLIRTDGTLITVLFVYIPPYTMITTMT